MTPSTAANKDAGALANERKHYLGAIRLRLERLYDECPNDARLREHISDECDWLDAEIARNSAPQETRGDEPLYLRVITKDRIWYEPAASQQSPRLEREGIYQAAKEGNLQFWRDQAAHQATFEAWKNGGYIGDCPQTMKGTLVDYVTDAILAILSPDTTVASSTSHAPYDVRFHENQIDQYETPVSSNHPREIGK